MFSGVYTALVTPFQDDGSVDEASLRKLVDFQIEGGVAGLVPMGTTGESPTLSHEEHIEIVKIVLEQTANRVPVIAGAGSNSTAEAIDLSRRSKESGVAATLQVSPYYNKPTQQGLFEHFTKIADEVDLPIIVYNIPGRCGVNIANDTMLRLAEHKNIVGVKEATGNLPQAMEFISRKPKDFVVLSGDDNMTFPLVMLGGNGVISVASNLLPKEMSDFIGQALEGNLEEARRRHFDLLPLFKGLFVETNPIPVKAAMSMKGLVKEVYRLPMCPMQKTNREGLKSLLKDMNLI
jgi:4-hydroxy-tetrahydrodipicolinate synthase